MSSPFRCLHAVTTSIADISSGFPILVHSHHRWDSVWQRPPLLFSRLATSHDILFVEEPQFLDDLRRPTFDCREPQPNVHRFVPRLPSSYRVNETVSLIAARTLLLELVGGSGDLAHRFDAPVQWFHSARPAPTMLGAFNECAVVYERVDDPAPARIERFLLTRADVVFSGGWAPADGMSGAHERVRTIRELTLLIEEAIASRQRRRRAVMTARAASFL